MTALVEAPHLGQTVFVSNFRCLFERSREEQLDGVDRITRTDQPDEFPRRQTSVTERLQMSEMCRTFKPKSNLKVVCFFFLSVMKHNQALCERFNDPPLPLWVLLWMNNNDHRPETNTADGRLRSDSWSEKSGEAAF